MRAEFEVGKFYKVQPFGGGYLDHRKINCLCVRRSKSKVWFQHVNRNADGKFFVQRKILFWWVDVTKPINEASDITLTFHTEDAAERYIREVLCGYLPKPTFVKYVLVNENRKEAK